MEEKHDVPPTATVAPMQKPPASNEPTSAMLKGDIDSGRTGDKNEVFDPGLSPLGTDDEAAGTPPETYRIRLARHYETVQRWRVNRKTSAAHNKNDGVPVVYIGFIAAVALVLLVGLVAF
jgi:hypothetical protein